VRMTFVALSLHGRSSDLLAPATFAMIAGGDRAMFDRITLRPRMLSPTTDMDLSQPILGDTHFMPIIVGPVSDQKRFHPDGEVARSEEHTSELQSRSDLVC